MHGNTLPRHTQPPLVEGSPNPQEHPLGLGAVADVQQSSLRLGSFNLVSGDIPCNLQQHMELKILPGLTFSISKYKLWIDKAVFHTCAVVFCRFIVWLYMDG